MSNKIKRQKYTNLVDFIRVNASVDSNGLVTSTYTTGKECAHKNGWYFTHIGFFWNTKYLVCTDCERTIKQ